MKNRKKEFIDKYKEINSYWNWYDYLISVGLRELYGEYHELQRRYFKLNKKTSKLSKLEDDSYE